MLTGRDSVRYTAHAEHEAKDVRGRWQRCAVCRCETPCKGALLHLSNARFCYTKFPAKTYCNMFHSKVAVIFSTPPFL